MIKARPRLYFHRRLSDSKPRMPRDWASLSAFGQLPSRIQPFVGRHDAIEGLSYQIQQTAQPRIVISGEAGIGKTAMAIEVAHRFFESHYYANFRGGDVEPLDWAIVLTRWLKANRVDAIPDELAARLQRFQTWINQKAAPLLMLDDVQNETQIKPFLDLNCAVLITSRKAIPIAGSINVALSGLEESLTLLRQQIGFAAVAAELEASDRIIQHCDRVPLAIVLAGSAINQTTPLQEFETQLSKRKASLQLAPVRLLFELSYQSLDSTASRLLRLVSLLVESQFTPTFAATLLESTEAIAIAAINQLVALKFVNATDTPYYRFSHDLIRLYARQQVSIEDSIEQRQAARLSICCWYLEQMESVASNELTLNWMEAERLNLLAAIEWAEQAQAWEIVVRLSGPIAEFLDQCGDRSRGRTVLRTAIAASRRLSDSFYEAAALNNLGNLELRQQQWQQARSCYEQSLEIFSRSNDAVHQARTRVNLGVLNALQNQSITAALHWKTALNLLHDLPEQAELQRSLASIDPDLFEAAGGAISDDPPALGFFQNFTQRLKRLILE